MDECDDIRDGVLPPLQVKVATFVLHEAATDGDEAAVSTGELLNAVNDFRGDLDLS